MGDPGTTEISIAGVIYLVFAVVMTFLCGSAVMLPMQTVVTIGKLYVNRYFGGNNA